MGRWVYQNEHTHQLYMIRGTVTDPVGCADKPMFPRSLKIKGLENIVPNGL